MKLVNPCRKLALCPAQTTHYAHCGAGEANTSSKNSRGLELYWILYFSNTVRIFLWRGKVVGMGKEADFKRGTHQPQRQFSIAHTHTHTQWPYSLFQASLSPTGKSQSTWWECDNSKVCLVSFETNNSQIPYLAKDNCPALLFVLHVRSLSVNIEIIFHFLKTPGSCLL